MKIEISYRAATLAVLIGFAAAARGQEAEIKRSLGAVDISADGRLVVYVEHQQQGGKYLRSEVRAVTADGSGNRLLATGTFVNGLTVSPDGRSVVFLNVATDGGDLWFSTTQGTGLRQLTRSPASEQNPRYSADGRAVLFSRRGESPLGSGGGYSVDLATGQERKILGEDYNVDEIGPMAEGDPAWYAVCGPLDANGRPANGLTFKKILARVPFDGSAPRQLFPSVTEVRSYQAGRGWALLLAGGSPPQPSLVEQGAPKPLPFRNLSRLAADGKIGAGADLDVNLRPFVALYDLAKNARRPLAGAAFEELQPRAVDQVELRKALQALIGAGAEDFKSIRSGEGRKLGSRTLYPSMLAVPGTQKVEISVPDEPNSFRRPEVTAEIFHGDDVDVSRARYAEWVKAVQAVLPDWKLSESKTEVIGNPHWNGVFTNGGDVEVRVHNSVDPVLRAMTVLRITRLEKAEAAAPPAEPAPTPAGAFAAALTQLINGAADEFKSIRMGSGEKILDDQKSYGTAVRLPGLGPTTLTVPDRPDRFNRPGARAEIFLKGSRGASQARFDQFVAEVRAALPGWSVTEMPSDQDGILSLRTSFRKAGAPATVQLNLFHSDKIGGGTLTLYVFGA